MLTTLLASLAFAVLRLDALNAFSITLRAPTECGSCHGFGEIPGSPSTHDPVGSAACPDCKGRGERLVSSWDDDAARASHAVLSVKLTHPDAVAPARARANALRASLDATVAHTLGQRGCRVCLTLRPRDEVSDDNVCIHCSVGSHDIGNHQREASLEVIERRLVACRPASFPRTSKLTEVA